MAELEATPPFAVGLNDVFTEKRIRIATICMALFLVTFAVYWFVGPQDTSYPHQTSQANNILHGHLDMQPDLTKNYNTLERVLYDGHGFCFLPGDPEAAKVVNPRFSADCKTFMQHSLGPAFLVLPGVAIFGNDLNQTLVSVIFGAMLAPLVFLIAARFSSKLVNQLVLTALMIFGTVFFWIAMNGGVWFFAHTTATFFIFAAIYWTVARPNPLLAGVGLGAAFMCRPTMIATGLFFPIMFIPLWLRQPNEEGQKWGLNWGPILGFAAGLAPFLALEGVVNYLRFDNPTETGYGYTEQTRQTYLNFVYPKGLFDISYVTRHPPVIFEAMPGFNGPGADCGNGIDCAPITTSSGGMAIWATTPMFLGAMFTGVSDKRIARVGALFLGLACVFILSRAVSHYWESSWQTQKLPFGAELLPFWGMIIVAIGFALWKRDRLLIACWAAIIPTAFAIFNFAATGWAQFGYRYGLDFTPFLWLLVARLIGDNLKWWHIALITVAIAVNLGGVLWTYQFDPHQTHNLIWTTL